MGSLPPGTTTEELRQLFEPFGEISECDVVNRCGFLHLEDKTLAFKAIDELNNTTFKGTRITVEKGRVKPPNRDRGGPMMGRGGPRNGFGPMRGGPRDNFRGSPYMRDGGDFDRPRGPPRGGFGGGYDRGFGGRPGPMNRPPMNDGYSNGGDRRPYMDDRSGGYGNGGYGDSGYGMNQGIYLIISLQLFFFLAVTTDKNISLLFSAYLICISFCLLFYKHFIIHIACIFNLDFY